MHVEGSPWDESNDLVQRQLGDLGFFPPLDYSTRHLIQLLQDLSTYGFHHSADVVTRDRCNFLLRRLAEHPPGKHTTGYDSTTITTTTMEQCGYRAQSILHNMQVFDHKKTRAPSPGKDDDRFLSEWPAPNAETYRVILKLFSDVGVCKDLSYPRRAQSIVDYMESRFRDHGDWEFKTTASHWNQVLMCWKACQDWQRSAHAANETFQRMPLKDPSSFYHVMAICTNVGIPTADRDKAAELGAQVAARLWKHHIMDATLPQQAQQQDQDDRERLLNNLSSPFYAAFLQAVRAFPNSEIIRVSMFDQCFQMACRQGKVNFHVLQEFLVHARSKMVTVKHLGRYLEAIHGMDSSTAVNRLLELVPTQWTARAEDSRKGR